ncbi:MAG: TIR domain-containing protein [Chromatiaceae bacterium]|nr:TIR domain-containing protein [Chromatiaceae bacterium]
MAGTGRSKVFISYSRADLAFTDELVAALALSSDFEILIDRIGIGHGEEWRQRLSRLIVECDTMVFVLSPDSVSSEVCAWEIKEARRLSKRIIPILWRAVDFSKVPEDLSAINAVPFDREHAVSGLPKLVAALESDLAWLREHTRLGEKAVEWELSGRAPAYLLRGAALVAVRQWQNEKPVNAPAPTELQHAFIQASEEEDSRLLSDERRRLEELEKAKAIAEAERDAAQTARANEASAARRVVRATTVGLVVALVLFAVAAATGWVAYRKAQDERVAAERAEQEAARASSAAASADAQRDTALLVQSRFLARAAREHLTQGDVANALGLARAALPADLTAPDRPFAIEPVQVIFDAYGKLHELATLRGHTAGLDGVMALSGERMLTWGRDGTLRWWGTDGTLLKTVLAHQNPTEPGSSEDTGVHGVLRLQDGRLLSWGVDKTARLWNDDGRFIETFLDEPSWIRFERLDDGRIAALIGNEYRVWSPGLEPLIVLRSPLKQIMGARLLSDGRFLTWQQGPGREAGKLAYTAMSWHADGTPDAVLEGHEHNLRGAFELTDGRIVTWENGPAVHIWSVEGKLETVIEKAHLYGPQGAFALRDGRFLTWGQEALHDNVWWARLWTAQGDSVPLIAASDLPLQGFELADARLLLGTNSRTPTIWRTDGTRGPVLRGHEKPAYAAAQWPDGRIVTYGADRTARVWGRDGAPLLVLRGHEAGVSGVQRLDGERLLTWSFWDRTARVWSEAPWPRSELHLEGGEAAGVQQLSSGDIAVHTNSGSIVLYDTDLRPGPVLRNESRDVAGLVEMPDGRLLTLGSIFVDRQSGPALRIWNRAGEVIGDLAGPDAEFLHVATTPSGRILAFGRSGQVWLWGPDLQLVGRREATGTTQFYRVVALQGGRYVTVGDDNRLQLWSAEGEPGKVFNVHEPLAPKQIVTFGDGRILTTFWGGPPRIWEADGERGSPLGLGEASAAMTATPLKDGGILLNGIDGRLFVVSPGGAVTEAQYPSGADGRYRQRQVLPLADGRLLVSTSGRDTRIWNTDGTAGPRALDGPVSGAQSLSDGSLLVWPVGRNDLQIIRPDGEPGPKLRGHTSPVRRAFQLSDGRVLSWAKDATVRIWPGSIAQAVAWADDVIARLQPLTFGERCDYYLEPPTGCAKVGEP